MNVYNFLCLVSVILSLMSIVYWIMLISSPNFSLDATGNAENVIGKVGMRAHYLVTYRGIQSINCFVIFLRIFKFFTFSKRLYAFSEVISSAGYDILFFVIMLVILLIGYSIMGFALFGKMLPEFSTIPRAFLQCFRFLCGDFDY
jgi:hypothetical protein